MHRVLATRPYRPSVFPSMMCKPVQDCLCLLGLHHRFPTSNLLCHDCVLQDTDMQTTTQHKSHLSRQATSPTPWQVSCSARLTKRSMEVIQVRKCIHLLYTAQSAQAQLVMHCAGYAELSYPDLATYAPLHAAHHQLPHHQAAATYSHAQSLLQGRMQADQQQCQHQLSEPAMACEESWPWDDNLLDSPGSDSFESASTTYDPPSDESIPESYTSSTASASALIPAHAPHLAGSYQDVRFQPQGPFRPFQYCGQSSGMLAVSKPPLAPAACQLVKASEHRR